MPPLREFPFTTGTAFVALITLIIGLTMNSLLQLQMLGTKISTVVEQHNQKIDIITQIQVASHFRTDSLFRMALTEDPFERDALFMEYNRAGFLVGSRRNFLRQMGLARNEVASFKAQSRLIIDIEAIQDRLTTLLAAGRDAEARLIFVEEAIPIQKAFNLQLADMRTLYHRANLTALQEAQQTYRHTFLLTLAFGSMAIMLAIVVAWRTMGNIRKKSRQIIEQVAELERSHAALREEATHDPLTGLANRRLFYDRLQQAIRHAHRYDEKIGILYVDLDQFKAINDQHGHHIGDAVLTEVARRLTTHIRDSDTVARLGGDEFVVLLEAVTGHEDFLAAANKIRDALNTDRQVPGLGILFTASVGMALFPEDGSNEDSLMRAADAAMYRAKNDRRSGDLNPPPVNAT